MQERIKIEYGYKEQVFIYWKKYDLMTLSQITEQITDHYLENNNFIGFDIPNNLLLEWFKKENSK